ncbi:Hsk1-Dfp1 kinase complex regulatory subunit Dfp1 [Schizosaccharomyces pombe]|uniref:Hsk1-interacting molecule 1 n=1 Tax=Schizosaccharomyces pombe (strain 972 / ATCC 24843) TaxID=284812 RepID=HIM1_SCHPO|nr:Hsk1-Dfp1 kinase complex regulatory subunit Dfp1 [Schizosaccharomyces pombe]O59836.1 RecName: Full=Hsk1-interacting molecule 1; AltName: Full=DNA repair protein rad35 [Schizosaccharomyces pombe 972h-]AAD03738.1 Hsk1 protein kinase subunit Dfp1 [Schizosaccharomyces pombe]CAA19117.1 Hsk1-Dfp1 kinase complex regulatory subunit Dfp1 [Schizosaccharomyces pombe]CAA76653.1 rad35 [Schizosaccharomyces pombe]BAA78328.1 Him1/ Dfp1/ Rad35 [Schizosaccharomyces pombe]|eukprot:NP_588105.1 Hsk1-Dfp1 kinase complex regulatory subunit Dfp1 [Schizosaccharomyces pombe]
MNLGRCPLAPRSANIVLPKHDAVSKQKEYRIEEKTNEAQREEIITWKDNREDEGEVKTDFEVVNNENIITTTPKHQTVITPKSYRKSVKRIKHDAPQNEDIPVMKGLAPINADTESKAESMAAGKVLGSKNSSQKARLQEWKRQYKKAFPHFRFYLDGCDPSVAHRVKKQIQQLGGHVETFFSGNVTHVATVRAIQDVSVKYAKQDVITKARQLNMKIWSMEKLCNRVLKTLMENDQCTTNAPTKQGNDLSYLLYVEKVQGTNERDLSVPRQDFVHFRGPYLYVHDIANIYKPILLREWQKPLPDRDVPWPTFRATSIGRCPFVPETKYRLSTSKSLVAKNDQQLLQRQSQEPSLILRANSMKASLPDISNTGISGMNTNTTYNTNINNTPQTAISGITQDTSPSIRTNCHHCLDDGMQASGIVQSNLTSAAMSNNSAIRSGSAASVPVVTINGRDIAELKKRIIQQKSGMIGKDYSYKAMLHNTSQRKIRVDAKPGYCENCREKFDNFESHIRSSRHRRFAENNDNFKDLDELFALVQRPLRPD